MNTQIQAYIEQDTEKVADLIAAYPQNIPVEKSPLTAQKAMAQNLQ